MNINIEGIKTGAEKIVVPARAMGGVMIDTAEKMLSLQLESCKVYSDIAFRQMKKVPEVQSFEQVGDLLWGQIEPISEFNKQLLNDWKSLMSINTEFNQSVKEVFTSSHLSEENTSGNSKPARDIKKAAEPAKKTASNK